MEWKSIAPHGPDPGWKGLVVDSSAKPVKASRTKAKVQSRPSKKAVPLSQRRLSFFGKRDPFTSPLRACPHVIELD